MKWGDICYQLNPENLQIPKVKRKKQKWISEWIVKYSDSNKIVLGRAVYTCTEKRQVNDADKFYTRHIHNWMALGAFLWNNWLKSMIPQRSNFGPAKFMYSVKKEIILSPSSDIQFNWQVWLIHLVESTKSLPGSAKDHEIQVNKWVENDTFK